MKQYIVDAFTEKIFGGNPAAVCVVEKFPPEELMLNIARENNLSETAFVVKEKNFYRLRWFTPAVEIDFCGHATLASAFVILTQVEKNLPAVEFETLSGRFTVERKGKLFEMNFPAYEPKKIAVTAAMSAAVNAKVLEAYLARDLLLVLDSAAAVENLTPDLDKLAKLDGLIQAVTAADENFDCVSRVFAPKIKIAEDPVTGSTHCLIAPYWSERLGKKKILARQASARGGILHCEVAGERVKISGSAVLVAVADLKI
ncbi:MAG: PhzF family phenazine biosynthesis protein [Selenomonadaceae bacterium]|nr:PhzF family phenazine biosynthesis protein [Selenomonadaceae bacterium]MBQ7494108.1 PhzF family phenazine biosynthesis protein [Selenomonadaceae bacterium]